MHDAIGGEINLHKNLPRFPVKISQMTTVLVCTVENFALYMREGDREQRVFERMRYYEKVWDKMREGCSSKTNRPANETLVHASENFKLKKAVIENLNSAFHFDEFSNDRVWYHSMRNDYHPNDQRFFDLKSASIPGLSVSKWDIDNSSTTPWMRDAYLKQRLLSYKSDLAHRAPYCLSVPLGLEVVGKSIHPISHASSDEDLAIAIIRSLICQTV